MAEVLFYQLTASPLEQNLPDMLEKSLRRGWRVLLRCGSAHGLAQIDEMLWTYRADSFLPHGAAHPADQPICLTLGDENPNRATVLMLVDNARAHPAEMAGFDRACLIFDGHDPAAVDAARRDWRAVKAAGLPAKYWAQDEGRWVQKA